MAGTLLISSFYEEISCLLQCSAVYSRDWTVLCCVGQKKRPQEINWRINTQYEGWFDKHHS